MRENQPSTEWMNDDLTRCALHALDPQQLLLLAEATGGVWRQQEGGSWEVGVITDAMLAALRENGGFTICAAKERDALRGDRENGGLNLQFVHFLFTVGNYYIAFFHRTL